MFYSLVIFYGIMIVRVGCVYYRIISSEFNSTEDLRIKIGSS